MKKTALSKPQFSRFGHAGAYLALFLIFSGICLILYFTASKITVKYADTPGIHTSLADMESDGTEGYYYNLIGELVYEALYERFEKDEVYESLRTFGYTDTEINDAVMEIGLDWETKSIKNVQSKYFKELYQSGIITEDGMIP